MFNEARFSLERSKDTFNNNVKDSFGHSIVSDVYEPVTAEIARLQICYEESELKKREIQVITAELRMIL